MTINSIVSTTVPASTVVDGFWNDDKNSAHAVLMNDGKGTYTWRRSAAWRTFLGLFGSARVARIVAD